MSKMPAKKKSCFQITSVTQAQVAASSITDDTESLDDPDESRTEDVSSEIFDVSRADLEPEVCDRSSSDETLNNVGGESDAHGVIALHIPQDGQLPAVSGPPNGGFAFRGAAGSGVAHVSPHVLAASAPAAPPPATVLQQPAPLSAGGTANNVTIGTSQAPTAAPTVTASSTTTTTTTASCSSRFRVIKLDHGTGEPFRRGRWTCMEFYDRDPEGGSVMSRTVDVKPSALDQNADRDSGLGATGSSVVAPSALVAQGPDSAADASCLAPAHLPPVDPQPPGYGIGHQPASAAFQPPGYGGGGGGKPAAVPVPAQQPQVQVSVPQPPIPAAAPQTLLPPGHNGAPLQKSPSMPPATQSQPFAYPAPHHLPSVSPVGQSEYRPPPPQQPQQPQLLSIATAGPMGPPVSQGPSPVMTPAAAAGAQALGLLMQAGEPVAVSLPGNQQPAPAQPGLLQQSVAVAVAVAGGPVSAPLPQPLPSGLAGIVPVSVAVAAPPGVQNVPTAVPGSSPAAAAAVAPLTLPNQAAAAVAGQLLLGARGGGGVVSGLAFGQAPPVAPAEETRRKSEALPQPSGVSGKDAARALIPESLQLTAPSVNSLFGIPIALDGDEDRNPSTAFYLAFPPDRAQNSKSHSDSASGASVVAIDNKIEQAMDLVKSHLMYAVREEVEVLKEQIKELYERNSVLERENAVLKSLANSEQLSQLSTQLANPGSTSPQQQQQQQQQPQPQQPPAAGSAPPAPQEGGQPLPLSLPHQPNVSSA
ncbi:TSC22 domain family protein 2-like isoform X1 [Anguilla anguilla]|uniref:TSC22 domain family protein 2-like isoform X1 n=1 Tax=Anguilla anguilla TaxID=7936 RepID=UPI0015B2AE7E|nr:TSC22 domain family protein 2-like isoform X1 [Anguilla anguilla]